MVARLLLSVAALLLAPAVQSYTCKSVAEVLSDTPTTSTLSGLVSKVAPSLRNILQSHDKKKPKLTFFAPSDAALEAVSPQALAQLVNNTGLLSNLLGYHIVPNAALAAKSIKDGQQARSVLRSAVQPFSFRVAPNSTVSIDAIASSADVVQSDIKTCRGYIHVINAILLPATLDSLLKSGTTRPGTGGEAPPTLAKPPTEAPPVGGIEG